MLPDDRARAIQCMEALLMSRNALAGDDMPCQIEEGLFLGSVKAAQNKNALEALNITHILVVARSLEPAYPNDFIYKRIEVLDSSKENLKQHFQECYDFIDNAIRDGSRVLVHCFAGLSRSVTIVISYLMKKHSISLAEAIEVVRSKRPQVSPNLGFLLQLKDFERSILGI